MPCSVYIVWWTGGDTTGLYWTPKSNLCLREGCAAVAKTGLFGGTIGGAGVVTDVGFEVQKRAVGDGPRAPGAGCDEERGARLTVTGVGGMAGVVVDHNNFK